jgi:hypothetical protein
MTNTQLVVGLVGAVAVIAGISVVRGKQKTKRYGDRAIERRKAANMFAAGVFPRRRAIDQSGQKPVFERRQSAYEQL